MDASYRLLLRLFPAELPHLQDAFVDKLLELLPRLSSCKPVEMVKLLQTTLRQSGPLQLRLPLQVRRVTAVGGATGGSGSTSLLLHRSIGPRPPSPSPRGSRTIR